MGHDHNGGSKSEYHHGVQQSSRHDIPVSIPFSVLTHVYIHLSIISRATCGSIGASALAGYQRYTGWSYLTSPLYRQYIFRNPLPLEGNHHMLVRRTETAFVLIGIRPSPFTAQASCQPRTHSLPLLQTRAIESRSSAQQRRAAVEGLGCINS